MEYVPMLAPFGAFLVIALFGVGVYRTANHAGLVARKRLTAFAPAASSAMPASFGEGAALLKHKQYSSISVLNRLLQRGDLGTRMSRDLARAALPLRVGEYLLIRCLAALLLLLLVRNVTGSLVAALPAGAVGYVLPVLYVYRRQARRVRLFDDQLVDALTLIANALKSGYSFLQGMEAIAQEMPEPIGVEFEQALREIRVGGAVEEALLGISARVGSADFDLVVTAMVIQRQVGGNLTEILTNIAYTVRERHRILREIRVLTAEERMSGYIIAALPVLLLMLLSVINPGYIQGMVQQETGKILLGAGGVMEVLGLLVIRKIVDIEV